MRGLSVTIIGGLSMIVNEGCVGVLTVTGDLLMTTQNGLVGDDQNDSSVLCITSCFGNLVYRRPATEKC